MSRANGVEIAIITEPFLRAGSALRQSSGDREHPDRKTGFSPHAKERTETRSMREILPLPASQWRESCGLGYSEGDDGD